MVRYMHRKIRRDRPTEISKRSDITIQRSPSPSTRPLWLHKDIHRDLLRLSIPTVISTLAVPLLGVVDTAVLGRLPDVRQLAGAAAAGVVISVIFQMFFFLRMGTTALVAQHWGADDRRAATLVLFQSLAIALVIGVALIALQRIISIVGFGLVGAAADVTALGETYFRIRIWEAPFYLMMLAMTALMRGQGDALVPMWIVIGINVINVIGDLLLVPGTFGIPSFGVAGAAWASVVAHGAGWAASMIIGWRRVQAYWDWEWLRRWRELAWQRFFAVQTHLFIRTLALVLSMAAVTSLVARLQSAPVLAGHAILMQLWSLVSHAVDGFAYATETTIGHWLGRGNREKAHASGVAALLWGVGAGVVFAIVYFVGVDFIARFFTHDEQVIAVVVGLAWIVAISQPVSAAAYVFDGILIGATDTRYLRDAMLLSSGVFVAYIAAGWALFGLSLPLVWTALLVFMLARTVTLGVRFRSGAWYGEAERMAPAGD